MLMAIKLYPDIRLKSTLILDIYSNISYNIPFFKIVSNHYFDKNTRILSDYKIKPEIYLIVLIYNMHLANNYNVISSHYMRNLHSHYMQFKWITAPHGIPIESSNYQIPKVPFSLIPCFYIDKHRCKKKQGKQFML